MKLLLLSLALTAALISTQNNVSEGISSWDKKDCLVNSDCQSREYLCVKNKCRSRSPSSSSRVGSRCASVDDCVLPLTCTKRRCSFERTQSE